MWFGDRTRFQVQFFHPGYLYKESVAPNEVVDGQVRPVDDWMDTNAEAIEPTGLAPNDPPESAILAELTAGAYTAIVQGKGGISGVGLVEVYYIP